MSTENSKSTSGGTSFVTLLQVLFIGLKLGEVGVVAKWSWWWVCSPTLTSIAIVLLVCVVVFSLSAIKYFSLKNRLQRKAASLPPEAFRRK